MSPCSESGSFNSIAALYSVPTVQQLFAQRQIQSQLITSLSGQLSSPITNLIPSSDSSSFDSPILPSNQFTSSASSGSSSLITLLQAYQTNLLLSNTNCALNSDSSLLQNLLLQQTLANLPVKSDTLFPSLDDPLPLAKRPRTQLADDSPFFASNAINSEGKDASDVGSSPRQDDDSDGQEWPDSPSDTDPNIFCSTFNSPSGLDSSLPVDAQSPLSITKSGRIGVYSCDKCDKSFGKPSSLSRHKYEHSGTSH
jgi:hypothetical protein